jgi:polyprenyl P-hydroxybenzoate/phenylacrylic acid decarboxylase-like protein
MRGASRRVVVGVSGASGAIYGVRLLEVLHERRDIELHAIVSGGAKATIEFETDRAVAEVLKLADVIYDETDLAASLASGSFLTAGMAVAPCSMKTAGSLASSIDDNLIVRAADVHLKERRRLVLVVREAPLNANHLRVFSELTAAGAVILPAAPGFYHRPKTIGDLVDHVVGKTLDQLGVEHELFRRWTGPGLPRERRSSDD